METIKKHRWVLGILAAAFLLRTVLMLLCDGYSTDVTCFVAWSENMVKYGAGGFYTGGFFADYPPAYLYWLWGAGLINQALGVEPFSAVSLYILGLLPLFCDMFTAWLAWYLCERAGHSRLGIFALALLAFSPALVFNLAVWKQVVCRRRAVCAVGAHQATGVYTWPCAGNRLSAAAFWLAQ
ncbi:MAG: hypothetical protein RRY54_04500 [Angelakisella sp.]